MAHDEPSHLDLHCFPFCSWFWTDTLFAIMDMPKFKDEKIHFINSGVTGLTWCDFAIFHLYFIAKWSAWLCYLINIMIPLDFFHRKTIHIFLIPPRKHTMRVLISAYWEHFLFVFSCFAEKQRNKHVYMEKKVKHSLMIFLQLVNTKCWREINNNTP